MNIQIDRPFVEALVREFPALAYLQEQLRLGNRIEVSIEQLSEAELACLVRLYEEAGPEMRVRAAQIATLRDALHGDGVRFEAADLEQLMPGIARYLLKDAINGWMFTANVTSRPLPYLVTRLDYTPPSNDEAGRVYVELRANAKGALAAATLRIAVSDIVGKTVG